ncbi:MAG TPA: 4-vinyl reductase [Polyangia bacterium]|nr:4-vinyl reductase [Polyangia bacterium]
MARRPKGYVGTNHETIGSDLLAVLQSLEHLVRKDDPKAQQSLIVQQTLGRDQLERLARVDPNGWYPIAWLLELMDVLEGKLGRYGLLRMGRTLFKLSHQERVLRSAGSARDIVYGIDGMYHHANRGGAIGGWQVVSFGPNAAELEKTTPHHCWMEEGILSQALTAVGAPAVVSQKACFRDGADACRFVLTATAAGRWSGAKT